MQNESKSARRASLAAEIARALETIEGKPRAVFERKQRKRKAKPRRLIAYDLETTRIQVGTPRPLYLTVYGDGIAIEGAIQDMPHLTRILRAQLLTEENSGAAFVAWNANRFDVFFIAAALVLEPDLVLRPYMTQSKSLRGLRVIRAEDVDKPNARGWDFLDGIAMLGLTGTPLEKFAATFAPHLPKLKTIDFEREEFNPENPTHRDYAMRDSVALFAGMERAQQIMIETFDQPLSVTMGAACIRIFQSHIPDGVACEPPNDELRDIIHRYALRGGYCYCVRRYRGPVWKFDINQAYAAAMREARLPAGAPNRVDVVRPGEDRPYIARASLNYPEGSSPVPFYCKAIDARGRLAAVFAAREVGDTWLTSSEVEQLRREGWRVDVREAWVWPEWFSMRDFVDRLETLRQTCDGGPSGPIGTMVKATGNHSYGKTAEQLSPLQFVIASECPDDFVPFYGDETTPLDHVFYRIDEDAEARAWHQPQIAAFITAHVRMVIRRAALLAPDAWLYADTDCVIYSRPVDGLDIHPTRYGAFKIEETGATYQIIAKKVYAEVADPGASKTPKRSAKGMNVKRLTADDFSRWFDGEPPIQHQIQLQNFMSVMRGAEMFRRQTREGTRVERSI